MRLFVAVRPPISVLDAIEALPRPEDSRVRWTTRDQWHVTLRFFGDVDDPAPIVDAIALCLAGVEPVQVALGPRAAMFGRQIVHLPVEGLNHLASTIVTATAALGDPPDARPFRGHVTLARSKGRAVDTSALQLERVWVVDAVELMRSHLGRGGARYETLERFELGG